MWILDTAFRDGVDLWCRKGNATCQHYEYDPPFYLYLPDPHEHHEMIGVLEENFRAEPCTISTLFGEVEGFSVFGDRTIAEAIERQTCFVAQLFNVDIRRDQQFMAEHDRVPCLKTGESRFTPDFEWDLRTLTVRIADDPARSVLCTDAEVISDQQEHLRGGGSTVAADLFSLVESIDPDIILMSHADAWMPKFRAFSHKSGLDLPFSRNGRYRRMNSRSYWSYGRVEHKEAALIPDGRILIDTDQSFVYREGGLAGLFLASRLAGLPPNLTSRLTPGTLISSYEVYEAVQRGIVVPFRKAEAETLRKFTDVRSADRGGMMFQPYPGIYDSVEELDFTSMYPSIIVRHNLSPETIRNSEYRGFLPAVLEPVIHLRQQTKRMRASCPKYAGIDSLLKWMLVTCFGYTGYKNAKFGCIRVHEAITAHSREILIQTKDIAESLGFSVLHGIVDCLWVQGSQVSLLQERICSATGLPVEVAHFDWIVFLPLNDGSGAYTRYYGRLADGSIRVRGIAARRHDMPEFIRSMQQQMLESMKTIKTSDGLHQIRDLVGRMYSAAVQELPQADPALFAIHRRISRTRYAHRCLEGAAVQAYRDAGIEVAPGMQITYIVRNAQRYEVDPPWAAEKFDHRYYQDLLEKAWKEIAFAFEQKDRAGVRRWNSQREIF